jgi:histidyl-tRNA synthetase
MVSGTRHLSAIRGMNDLLPTESHLWQRFEAVTREWLRQYGYREIRMPLVEKTELFVRSIGAVTDIVEKEMYTFVDALNGESLTLRPEGTASCVRAVLEHNLLYPGPQRLWYSGPMFRHERPQKGRYRQFHQVGVEALGYGGPDVDAEQIIMCARLWTMLGLKGIRLELNCLGSAPERAAYRSRLVAYLESRAGELDADARRRLHTNPLRILDSKNPAMQDVVDAAPRLADFLGDVSRAHYDGLRGLLHAAGVEYGENPRLVRGLDYYNLTVFEWITEHLGAQGTVCGGGRYDGLVEQIGGKPAPASGFAMGVERLLALMQQGAPVGAEVPDAYVVHLGEHATPVAWRIAERLRDAGMRAILHCGGGSFKSQMRRADGSGALLALIVGDDEAIANAATVKPLRDAGEQTRIPIDTLAAHVGEYRKRHGIRS